MPLRWGIAGAGKVSHDFCTALASKLTETEHEVIAVATQSDQNRSNKFAMKHGIKKSYSSYEDLAKDKEIEVIYVAALNIKHYEICKIMINHGKNILCEKPFAMNSWQVKELLDLAKRKKVFIMEGLWSRFFPVYGYLRKMLKNASVGNLKEIRIKHGFLGEGSDRIVKKELGGGITLDIGVYAIQFVLFCFQEDPTTIKATGKTNKDGVDLYLEVELEFSNGKVAKINCTGMEQLENEALIIGSKGTIKIPTYWCPTSLVEPDGQIQTWLLTDPPAEMNFTNSCGLRYEADEVKKCIRGGKLYSDIVPPREMISIAVIEDEIRRQIGVHYDSDKP